MSHRGLTAGAVIAALCALTAACGSSDDSSSTTAPKPSTDLSGVRASVERAYKGTITAPPTQGPKAVKGKSIYLISIARASPSGGTVAGAAAQAAKVLGWKVTAVDGKGDPGKIAAAIAQAISAKADGVFLDAIDCAVVKSALVQAKRANVPVVATYGQDCDAAGGAPLFTRPIPVGSDGTVRTMLTGYGAAKADWLIARTNGEAKIIEMYHPDSQPAAFVHRGFVGEIERSCPNCKIVETVKTSVTELATGVSAQKFQTALAAHPEATAVHPLHDAMMALLEPVIKETGRTNLLMLGGEGTPIGVAALKSGATAIEAYVPLDWYAWAAMDTLNRIFDGEKATPRSGVGWELVDREHNVDPNGTVTVPYDFRGAYTRIWRGA